MSTAVRQAEPAASLIELSLPAKIVSLWPVMAPVALTVVFILARAYAGPRGFLYEGALTMLALICYISAAVLLLTNLFVKEAVLSRLGLITVAMGACFNLSGWMIRWIEAGDKEGWIGGINGLWRYVPLESLYPLTLGFCFGAAITTLVIIREPKYEFVGALTMPIVTVIMTIAMLLGNEITTLPPILDSYWRPIHVSVATIGYGVCLVSFGLAFAYVLKDGVRSEAIAIAVGLFGLLVYLSIGGSSILVGGHYGLSVMADKSTLPVRATLPYVGPLMTGTLAVILLSLALLTFDHLKRTERARRLAWKLFGSAAILQAMVLALVFFQINSAAGRTVQIPQNQHVSFGAWLAEQSQTSVPPNRYAEYASLWIQQNAAHLSVSAKSNPIETGALISLFVILSVVALFAWKRDAVMTALPPLPRIDALLNKTVGVAFPLLSLLLITGAVWANESWGRYWGWDPKEVGALVAWLAYAGFLHTRLAHGWRGRRSAYFALLGFALVIFTWIGVSFLLPGLHSYAG